MWNSFGMELGTWRGTHLDHLPVLCPDPRASMKRQHQLRGLQQRPEAGASCDQSGRDRVEEEMGWGPS